jgi:hypothetical protein
MLYQLAEKESLVLNPQQIRQAKPEVGDPSEYMAQSILKINRLFQLLYSQYGATVEDFNRFLAEREPRLLDAMQRAWQQMDRGVHNLYLERQLDFRTWRAWKQDVVAWKRLVAAAVQLFRVHKGMYESDVAWTSAEPGLQEQVSEEISV